jgi:hypothetical protein
VRKAFDALVAKLGPRGPFRISSVKTMITLQANGTFASFKPRKEWLDGELLLDGPHRVRCFHKVWALSARRWVHHFRLHGPGDLSPELVRLLKQALARARR